MTQMVHASGLGCDLLAALYLGIPTMLLPAFEPGAVLDAIERFVFQGKAAGPRPPARRSATRRFYGRG
jgi:hypothetical protein